MLNIHRHALGSVAHALLQRSGAADGSDEPKETAVRGVGMVRQDAKDLADKLNSDEGFGQDLEQLTDEAQNVKRGVALIRMELVSILGEEAMNSLPVPESTREMSNNYDIYPKDPKKKMQGPNKGSFYNDVFDLTTVGQKILRAVSEAEADNELGEAQKKERIGALKDRQNYGRNTFRKAVWLQFAIAAIGELDGSLIKFTELKDDKGLPKTPKSFLLEDVNDREKFKHLSADQVLNLEPETAATRFKEQGGKRSLYACLLDTLKSDSEDQGGDGADNASQVPEIQGVPMAGNYIAAMAAWAEKVDKDPKLGGVWVKEILKDDNADLRESLLTIENFINALTSKPEFQKLYKADQGDRLAGDKAKKNAA